MQFRANSSQSPVLTANFKDKSTSRVRREKRGRIVFHSLSHGGGAKHHLVSISHFDSGLYASKCLAIPVKSPTRHETERTRDNCSLVQINCAQGRKARRVTPQRRHDVIDHRAIRVS